MVVYFSGTGNTEHVARTLGDIICEPVVSVTDVKSENLELRGEKLVLAFPIYCWGVPPIVLDYIASLPERFIAEVKERGVPVVMVCTCGDDTGMAPEMLAGALAARGLELRGAWSVTMPNTYVILPGFDVDSSKVTLGKLEEAAPRIAAIAAMIERGEWEMDVHRGSFPWFKTKVIYPMKRTWAVNPRKFRTTQECVRCGRCVTVCPTGNVKMKSGQPAWGPDCAGCLACYHHCPTHAIEYGNRTNNKGQYFFNS